MNFPAFKEWQVIVEALGAGEQTLILRKGGIAEGRAGFAVKAKRFWLFPTRFHAQLEKTKPAAARWFGAADRGEPTASVTLRYFAEVVNTAFLDNWSVVGRLAPFHFWTEETVRERFAYGESPGLHALVVRVHRLGTPVELPLTPSMGGCKSWIDLPGDPSLTSSSPVLADEAFEARVIALSL